MNLPYTTPTWVDGVYSKPRPTGPPLFISPIPRTSAKYILKQKFDVFINSFLPLPLNTKHPNYPNYVLVNEGDFEELGGAAVRFTRTYAQVPASWSDKKTFAYQFIGTNYVTPTPPPTWPTVYSRLPFSRRVQSRIAYDYFLVGQTFTPKADDYGSAVADGNAASNGTGTVASPIDVDGNIPFNYALVYIAQAKINGTQFGGLSWSALVLSATTTPTASQYISMCNDANTNGWNATLSSQAYDQTNPAQTIVDLTKTTYGGQIPAEDSSLDLWMGNIFVRSTRYVLAQ